MKIHLKAARVRLLLAHALAAPARAPTFGQMHEGRCRRDGQDVATDGTSPAAWPTADDVDPAKVPPGLWLVGDSGIDILSNGTPGPGRAGDAHVARAKECDPATDPDGWHDTKDAAFGRDDGVEFLDHAFADALLATERGGLVCLDVTPDRIAVPEQRAAGGAGVPGAAR